MLELYDVTLVAVDCIQPEHACRALKYSSRGIKFADVLLFTSSDLSCQGITRQQIEKLGSLGEYSRFMLRELLQYVRTKYLITVQADGFIINPHLWRSEFLDYDYIGAPWPATAPWCSRSRVGNGGFSLRSRRFLELAAALDDDFEHEDVTITNTYYDYFVSHGCRYAPVEIAMKFALEAKIPECEYSLNNCFGFHGKGDAFFHEGEGRQFKDRIALLDAVSCDSIMSET